MMTNEIQMDGDVWWSVSFANDGGPLIVLPRELLNHWYGSEPHPDENQGKLDSDRACEAMEPAETIAVGSGIGVVIGAQEMVYTAQWLRFGTSPEIFCVGWYHGNEDSEALVVDALRKSQQKWEMLHPQVRLEGELILMHVVDTGEDITEFPVEGSEFSHKLKSFIYGDRHFKMAVIGDGIPLQIRPGTYSIEASVLGGNLQRDSFGCVLCRWRPK